MTWYKHLVGCSVRLIIPLLVNESSRLTNKRTHFSYSATLRQNWPSGEYSLPMTIYGCNSPEVKQWSSAYINITFKHHVLVSNQETGKVGVKSPSLLAGPFGDRSYQMNFCVRESVSTVHSNQLDGRWPPGNYMVYGTEKGCPSGKKD